MPTTKKRYMIPVDEQLHAELTELAAELLEAHELGRTSRVQIQDQGTNGCVVPLREVIRLCIADYKAHRERSRKPRKTPTAQ